MVLQEMVVDSLGTDSRVDNKAQTPHIANISWRDRWPGL